jgi:hypothetical protein
MGEAQGSAARVLNGPGEVLQGDCEFGLTALTDGVAVAFDCAAGDCGSVETLWVDQAVSWNACCEDASSLATFEDTLRQALTGAAASPRVSLERTIADVTRTSVAHASPLARSLTPRPSSLLPLRRAPVAERGCSEHHHEPVDVRHSGAVGGDGAGRVHGGGVRRHAQRHGELPPGAVLRSA